MDSQDNPILTCCFAPSIQHLLKQSIHSQSKDKHGIVNCNASFIEPCWTIIVRQQATIEVPLQNVKRVHSRGKWSKGQHISLCEEMFIRVQISVARPDQLWKKFKYSQKHPSIEIEISVWTYSVISHCLFPLLVFPFSTLSDVSNMACRLPFLPCLTSLLSLPALLKLRVRTSHLW
jgi:hypothetical protein